MVDSEEFWNLNSYLVWTTFGLFLAHYRYPNEAYKNWNYRSATERTEIIGLITAKISVALIFCLMIMGIHKLIKRCMTKANLTVKWDNIYVQMASRTYAAYTGSIWGQFYWIKLNTLRRCINNQNNVGYVASGCDLEPEWILNIQRKMMMANGTEWIEASKLGFHSLELNSFYKALVTSIFSCRREYVEEFPAFVFSSVLFVIAASAFIVLTCSNFVKNDPGNGGGGGGGNGGGGGGGGGKCPADDKKIDESKKKKCDGCGTVHLMSTQHTCNQSDVGRNVNENVEDESIPEEMEDDEVVDTTSLHCPVIPNFYEIPEEFNISEDEEEAEDQEAKDEEDEDVARLPQKVIEDLNRHMRAINQKQKQARAVPPEVKKKIEKILTEFIRNLNEDESSEESEKESKDEIYRDAIEELEYENYSGPIDEPESDNRSSPSEESEPENASDPSEESEPENASDPSEESEPENHSDPMIEESEPENHSDPMIEEPECTNRSDPISEKEDSTENADETDEVEVIESGDAASSDDTRYIPATRRNLRRSTRLRNKGSDQSDEKKETPTPQRGRNKNKARR